MITVHPVEPVASSDRTCRQFPVVFDHNGRALVTMAAAAELTGYPKKYLTQQSYAAAQAVERVDMGAFLLVYVDTLNYLPPRK